MGTTCSVVSPNSLPTGKYYAMRMRSWGPGGWSTGTKVNATAPMRFNVGGAPGKLPANIVSNPRQGRPLIVWDDDANASTDTQWVQIVISGNGKTYSKWHQRNGSVPFACSGGRCWAEPDLNWTGGTYTVWMRAWGPGGFAIGGTNAPNAPQWVRGQNLALPSTPPAAPTGLTATGVNTSNVVFSWNGMANATWYQVVLKPASGAWSYDTWHLSYSLGAGCGDAIGVCTWQDPKLAGKLPPGNYLFSVRAWGPGGMGPYSTAAFIYTGLTP
jgi:hypothetical protein